MISLKVHYFAIVKNAFHVKTLFITIYIIKVLLHIYTYEKKIKRCTKLFKHWHCRSPDIKIHTCILTHTYIHARTHTYIYTETPQDTEMALLWMEKPTAT